MRISDVVIGHFSLLARRVSTTKISPMRAPAEVRFGLYRSNSFFFIKQLCPSNCVDASELATELQVCSIDWFLENKKLKTQNKYSSHHHKLIYYRGIIFFNKIPLALNLTYTHHSTTLNSELWFYSVCYYFVLTLKSICRSGWCHHLLLEINFRIWVRPPPPLKIFFYFMELLLGPTFWLYNT